MNDIGSSSASNLKLPIRVRIDSFTYSLEEIQNLKVSQTFDHKIKKNQQVILEAGGKAVAVGKIVSKNNKYFFRIKETI